MSQEIKPQEVEARTLEVHPLQLDWERIRWEKNYQAKFRLQQAWVNKCVASVIQLEQENRTLKAALQKVLSAKGRWVKITEADLIGKTP